MSATIVMPYYRNTKMLRLQMHEWSHYSPSEKTALSAIIVDDGSPQEEAAEHVFRRYAHEVGFRSLRLFKVVPNIPWNQDGARNLGMKHVDTEWTLLTDMDHMLKREQVARFLNFTSHKAKPGEYYMPDREEFDGIAVHPHANSYVMRKDDFWSMGGYDEDFAGVYGSDGNFRKCMRAGLREKGTHEFRLTRWTTAEISDANTRDWGRKDSKFHRSQHPSAEAKSKGPAYKATNHLRFEWNEVVL